MLSPIISISVTIQITAARPSTPKPNDDANIENSKADEQYKARSIFSKNNEMISRGRNTSIKPIMYGDFDLKNMYK